MPKIKTLAPRVPIMRTGRTAAPVDRPRGDTWMRARAAQLQREPLCRHCQAAGRVTLACEVDHIQPIAAGGAGLDPTNLQSLCLDCHQAKTLQDVAKMRGAS